MPFDKKFWVTFAVAFVVTMALGFVVHGLILAGDYAALPGVMRTPAEQEARFGFMLAAHAILAFGLSWLYRGGRDAGKPWLGQGVRFGFAFALAALVPIYLIYHTVANFPLDLALKQVVLDTLGSIVAGVALAFVNK
jgi:prepilin signal peptidase PulO-like enzyme (type II secretory pathway)